MMHDHPEVKQEVEAIEASLIAHASLQANETPEALREKILSSATGSQARVVDMQAVEKRRLNFYRFAAAVAAILFLISAGVNFFLYQNLEQAKEQIALLNQEKEQITLVFRAEKARYEEQFAAISSSESRTVMMKGTAASPASIATVYWNKQSREVYINVNSLPAPPSGKQYQLWALAGGKPVDAGVFETGEGKGMQRMKDIGDAQAFAVTLENSGGSPVPSLDAMYLSGNL